MRCGRRRKTASDTLRNGIRRLPEAISARHNVYRGIGSCPIARLDSAARIHSWGQRAKLTGRERLAAISLAELRRYECGPHRIGFPDAVHRRKSLLFAITLAQHSEQPQKSRYAHIRRTMHPDSTAGVMLHCLEECM